MCNCMSNALQKFSTLKCNILQFQNADFQYKHWTTLTHNPDKSDEIQLTENGTHALCNCKSNA